MQRITTILFSIFLLVFCFSQKQRRQPAAYLPVYLAADKLFTEAERLALGKNYNEERESELNQRSLQLFLQSLPAITENVHDSLAFFCHFKIARLFHYFDSLSQAKEHYHQAISLKKKLPVLPDSFLFKPLLFTGIIHYSLNEFDSAFHFYKKAELVSDQYNQSLAEQERLYNRLGTMHYETGDFRQAINYFEKALTLLRVNDPFFKEFSVNYKNNIASTLLKLEKFEEARSIYQQLLPLGMYQNEIKQNLGSISLGLGKPDEAIKWFKQVQYNNSAVVLLFNKTGRAFFEAGKTDSANRYLQLALAENSKWNQNNKNIPHGLTLFYLAEKAAAENKFDEALSFYQQSIIQFHRGFNETDITKNPDKFSGIFSYVNLFNSLTGKADVLEKKYRQKKEIGILKSSLYAYHSAFKLASYVERTYDSDEARLFLGKIKHSVHSKPIDISLLLYDNTQQTNFLEDAYYFDQLNKASILSLNVQENELREKAVNGNELLRQEEILKKTITRLSIKAGQLRDSLALQNIAGLIRDNEIELGKLQEKITADPGWKQKDATDHIPTVKEVQRSLDNNTALLSFHLSDKELLTLLITSKRFEYYKTAINNTFFTNLEEFKTSLHNVSPDQRYNGTSVATELFQTIISPVYKVIKQSTRLIIIPDDELNYLPFEALQDENKKYLLEKFAVQYQFSTALLGKNIRTTGLSNSLAFAPFASGEQKDSSGLIFSSLPASKDEVSELQGRIFMDTSATKNNFLQLSNKHDIIHLATHASANNDTPSHSYVAFYPGTDDYKLYAREISDLKLDSVQLIILSACETGGGQLVKGEGLMSLSRAFAYAGCPNIITSLWKAEDKTTSFITQRLHYYLGKKYSKDKALQLAKLDLLRSDEIEPRLKTPDYWAHLLFIGNYEEDRGSSNWWFIAIAIIVGAIIYKLIKRKA